MIKYEYFADGTFRVTSYRLSDIMIFASLPYVAAILAIIFKLLWEMAILIRPHFQNHFRKIFALAVYGFLLFPAFSSHNR